MWIGRKLCLCDTLFDFVLYQLLSERKHKKKNQKYPFRIVHFAVSQKDETNTKVFKFDQTTTEPAQPKRPFLISPPSPEEIMTELSETCIAKSILTLIMGGGLGFVFGAVFGSIGASTLADNPEIKRAWYKEVMIGFKNSFRQGWAMSKNFAMVGAMFSLFECYLEQGRAKSDRWNSIAAGCVSGGLLAYNAGPTGIAFGCGSFAAFSAAIDYFTGRYDPNLGASHDDGITSALTTLHPPEPVPKEQSKLD